MVAQIGAQWGNVLLWWTAGLALLGIVLSVAAWRMPVHREIGAGLTPQDVLSRFAGALLRAGFIAALLAWSLSLSHSGAWWSLIPLTVAVIAVVRWLITFVRWWRSFWNPAIR